MMSFPTPTRRQAKPTSSSSIPPPILPAPVTTASSSSGPSQLTSLLNADPPPSPTSSRKRKAPTSPFDSNVSISSILTYGDRGGSKSAVEEQPEPSPSQAVKRSRTNTPWTAEEERRLKSLRDAGSNWSEIAKTFPSRTEGSVKKHWYKDMHYADFAEDESAALLAAIRDYEANKWKHIGAKLNKPAKACEQYAKEHFSGRV